MHETGQVKKEEKYECKWITILRSKIKTCCKSKDRKNGKFSKIFFFFFFFFCFVVDHTAKQSLYKIDVYTIYRLAAKL